MLFMISHGVIIPCLIRGYGKMIIKSTLFGKFYIIVIWIGSLVPIYIFTTKNLPLGLIIFTVIFSIGMFCGVILYFTTRITLSAKGIFLTRNMGIGWFMPKEYGFYWHEIESVESLFFNFLPVKIFWISGIWKGHNQQILFGSLWTLKREALVYISDHVHRDVFNKSTYKLAQKYKNKLEKKARI